jgi:hypothetical protein
LEEALEDAFSGTTSLFDIPRALTGITDRDSPAQKFRSHDIKIGVTAVNTITDQTTIMTNYNRKTNDGIKIISSFNVLLLMFPESRCPLLYRETDIYLDFDVWEA